jgi:hypothetical protein
MDSPPGLGRTGGAAGGIPRHGTAESRRSGRGEVAIVAASAYLTGNCGESPSVRLPVDFVAPFLIFVVPCLP